MTEFAELGLAAPLVRALRDANYTVPTPIQGRAIPPILGGRNVVGCAQTGTGKTAAFVLPILQRLSAVPSNGRVRALVVAPTRELALQIAERAAVYARHMSIRTRVVFGGASVGRQEADLATRPDLLVATPGRLLDLVSRGTLNLAGVEILVLDEADRMLDMGFLPDVRRILKLTANRKQTLLFSATMPPPIRKLTDEFVSNSVDVAVDPDVSSAETVTQTAYHVANKADKLGLLERILKKDCADRVIVFTRTKHGARRLTRQLTSRGIAADEIHGNKSQNARQRALGSFKDGTTRVLVATDVASRGIDVDDVTLVVNYDLPDVAESYVHRIGRTGRKGRSGQAVAFCDPEERSQLRAIETYLKRRILVVHEAPNGGQQHVEHHLPEAPERAGSPRPSEGKSPSPGRAQERPRHPRRGRTRR
jgi:ATP-dependent RNA helicase RhlE